MKRAQCPTKNLGISGQDFKLLDFHSGQMVNEGSECAKAASISSISSMTSCCRVGSRWFEPGKQQDLNLL